MAAQDIKPGYKQSTLGLIPEDWEIVFLGKIGETYAGLSGKNKDDFGNGFPYIPYTNIFSNSIVNENNFDYVNINENENQNSVETGDIFFTTSSETPDEVGMCSCYLGNQKNLYLNSFSFGFRLYNKNNTTPVYLSQFFRSNYGRKIIYKLAQGATRYNLSKEGLLKQEIPLPPLPEQEAIAKILGKVDETIEKTQNMIEKLELRNKGLEQKLLKNNTWEYKPIEKIASEFSKRNKEDKNIIVLSCTKYDGLVPSLEYFGKKIFSDNLTTYKLIPKGYFAYATNHIEEGSIGYQDKHEEAIISPMYTVFKTNDEINDYFLFRVLKTHKYILEYKKRMEGSIDRRGGLRRNVFSKIMVPVPTMEEQNKIMNILDKATEQTNLYKQKLEKLQELKKGLMQQLLTGKVRVKEFRN